MLKKIKPGGRDPVKKALAMADGPRKLQRLARLQLQAEYLTPLWQSITDEITRLQEAGWELRAVL